MSRYEYVMSSQLEAQQYSFYTLIMAAMRQADTENASKLRSVFPEVWDELQERYNTPGGVLEGESAITREDVS